MAEKEIKTTIGKSEHYKNGHTGIVEVLQFVVPTEENRYSQGYTVSGEDRPQDITNFANQLAEIEEIVGEEFLSDAQLPSKLDFDKKALQKELEQYSKIMDISSHFWHLAANVHMLEGARNGMLHFEEYHNIRYLKDMLQAPNAEAMDKVKTPFERLPLLQRLGRQEDNLAFKMKYLVKRYTSAQKKYALKLVEHGYLPTWGELCNKEEEFNYLAKDKEKKKIAEQSLQVIKDFKRIHGEFDRQLNEVYADYAQELIAAKEKGQNLQAVPTPFSKKTFWQRLTNSEGRGNSQLVNTLELCTPAEFAGLKELFAKGLPSAEQMYEAYDKYNRESERIRNTFDYERRKKLFDMLLKQYGKSLLDDKKLGWQCYKKNELPIEGKEKESFDKMSLKEVAERYGVEQMWTHKGIILIKEKIKVAKDNPKKLAETLIAARAIAQQKSKCFHVPLANRMFFAMIVGDEYANLPRQDVKDAKKYGKFSEVDNQFRKLFMALQPQKGEAEAVKRICDAHASGDLAVFIEKRQKQFDKFAQYLDGVLDQSADISQAKARLQAKFATKESAVQDITGGTAAAYRHADDMKKLSENGMHFKEAPQLDLKAYQRDVVGELKQKSNQRMDKLAQKRATRQAKKQGRE